MKPNTIELIRKLEPLNGLDGSHLQQLSKKMAIVRADPGEILMTLGSRDPYCYYLLSGSLELTAIDGHTRIIDDGTDAALRPVANLVPRMYEVVALKPAVCLRVEREHVEKAIAEQRSSRTLGGIPNVSEGIYERILGDIKANRLVLPSDPATAISLNQLLSTGRFTARQMARLALTDPSMSFKLIVAGRAESHGRSDGESNDCLQNVENLGRARIRSLVTKFTMEETFDTASGPVRQRASSLWQHSREVGVLSGLVAEHAKKASLDRNVATLTGVLHDIGAVPILCYADNYPEVASNPELLEGLVDEIHPHIGAQILRRWSFSSAVISASLEADDYTRNPGPEADYCDAVLVAQHQIFLRDGRKDIPAVKEIGAYERLGIGGDFLERHSEAFQAAGSFLNE